MLQSSRRVALIFDCKATATNSHVTPELARAVPPCSAALGHARCWTCDWRRLMAASRLTIGDNYRNAAAQSRRGAAAAAHAPRPRPTRTRWHVARQRPAAAAALRPGGPDGHSPSHEALSDWRCRIFWRAMLRCVARPQPCPDPSQGPTPRLRAHKRMPDGAGPPDSQRAAAACVVFA